MNGGKLVLENLSGEVRKGFSFFLTAKTQSFLREGHKAKHQLCTKIKSLSLDPSILIRCSSNHRYASIHPHSFV